MFLPLCLTVYVDDSTNHYAFPINFGSFFKCFVIVVFRESMMKHVLFLSMGRKCNFYWKDMKSPHGTSRNCVCVAIVLNGSAGAAHFQDLGDVFAVCPIKKRRECFANMHQMPANI